MIAEPKPSYGYALFWRLTVPHGRGLVITRQYPDLVLREYFLGGAHVVRLAHTPGEGTQDPSNLTGLRDLIERFMRIHAVVLLDSLEYLLISNGFVRVEAFVRDLTEIVAREKSVLLLSADQRAFEDHEWDSLTRALRSATGSQSNPFPMLRHRLQRQSTRRLQALPS